MQIFIVIDCSGVAFAFTTREAANEYVKNRAEFTSKRVQEVYIWEDA